MVWKANEGRCPYEAEIRDEGGGIAGHRAVHVRLFGGWDSKKAGHKPWPAAGARPPTNWRISRPPHPFEIKEYEVQ